MHTPVVPLPYWRLSGYYFFYFAFIGAFSPYFGLYLQSIGFSAWEIGLLMSQMQLMRLLGPYLWGTLADRSGQRMRIIRLAGLLSFLGFINFFWLQHLTGMLLAMAILAFFWSAALPLVETLTFDHLRGQRSSYSQIRLWGSVGFIAAVMGTGAVLDWQPADRVLWVCASLLAGIGLLAVALPEAVRPSGDAAGDASVGAIFKQPAVLAFFVACFAMSAAHGPFYIFYSIHLAEHAYSKTEIGLLWSLGVVAEIVVFLWMPRLEQRFSLRMLLLACFGAAVLRFALMGWGVASVFLMVIAQLMHGLTFGAFHASAIAAVNRWFAGKAQGRGQALYSSISFGAGGLAGRSLGGRLWDSWGAAWTLTLASGMALLGGLLVYYRVSDDAAGDVSGREKTPDPVP